MQKKGTKSPDGIIMPLIMPVTKDYYWYYYYFVLLFRDYYYISSYYYFFIIIMSFCHVTAVVPKLVYNNTSLCPVFAVAR
jgi:hypothetical protein